MPTNRKPTAARIERPALNLTPMAPRGLTPDPRECYRAGWEAQRALEKLAQEWADLPLFAATYRAEARAMGEHLHTVLYAFSKAADRGERDTFLNHRVGRVLNRTTQPRRTTA